MVLALVNSTVARVVAPWLAWLAASVLLLRVETVKSFVAVCPIRLRTVEEPGRAAGVVARCRWRPFRHATMPVHNAAEAIPSWFIASHGARLSGRLREQRDNLVAAIVDQVGGPAAFGVTAARPWRHGEIGAAFTRITRIRAWLVCASPGCVLVVPARNSAGTSTQGLGGLDAAPINVQRPGAVLQDVGNYSPCEGFPGNTDRFPGGFECGTESLGSHRFAAPSTNRPCSASL